MITKIGVNGALGRMGRRILSLAHENLSEFKIGGAFDVPASSKTGLDIGELLGAGKIGILVSTLKDPTRADLSVCETVIDFSGPEGAAWSLAAALSHQKGLVIGSTGLDRTQEEAIRAASSKIPIVYSSNMSVGVNLILELVSAAAKKLSLSFDIEITEAHHRHKKDSPSGTALSLAKVIASAKGWDLKKVLKYRHESKSETERSHEEIGMQVIRAGEIVGEHTVRFEGPAETIEIVHRSHSRDTFARGALLAAQFVAEKLRQNKPGLYTMADVLNVGTR